MHSRQASTQDSLAGSWLGEKVRAAHTDQGRRGYERPSEQGSTGKCNPWSERGSRPPMPLDSATAHQADGSPKREKHDFPAVPPQPLPVINPSSATHRGVRSAKHESPVGRRVTWRPLNPVLRRVSSR